jgi:hypothetical protein
MDRKYTTRSPFVHDYNPLTHLSQYNAPQPLIAQVTSSLSFRRPDGQGLSPMKRLAKSVPRTTYSDPLTGRVIDFSNSAAVSTFVSTAAMTLVPRMPAIKPIDQSPILAKTKLRTEVSNPITGDYYRVKADQGVLSSLGREEGSSPIRPIRTQSSSPVVRSPGETVHGIVGRHKHVAYASPYLFS